MTSTSYNDAVILKVDITYSVKYLETYIVMSNLSLLHTKCDGRNVRPDIVRRQFFRLIRLF